MKITLLLPNCGTNYLWQLGGLQALSELGFREHFDIVYGCSGGAWASIFFGLGDEVVSDWLKKAPQHYADWSKQRYREKIRSFSQDSRAVLERYGFFGEFDPSFSSYFKVLQLYPKFGGKIINVNGLEPSKIHELAVASSTIPGITGTVSRVNGNVYIDGGFLYRFRTDELHTEALENKVILFDPYNRNNLEADLTFRPSKPLPVGIKIGLPVTLQEKELEDVIAQGYDEVMASATEIYLILSDALPP